MRTLHTCLFILFSLLPVSLHAGKYYELFDSYLALHRVTFETYVDSRDSQSYRVYKVDKPFVIQCIDSIYCLDTVYVYLFAENIRYNTPHSKCPQDGCERYGRYYPIEEVETACPDGWSIPSATDANVVHSHQVKYDTVYGTSDRYIRKVHADVFPPDGTKITERYTRLDDFPSGWFDIKTHQFKYSDKIGTIWTLNGNAYHPAYIDFGLLNYEEMNTLVQSSGMEDNGNMYPVKCHKVVFNHKVDSTKIVPRTFNTWLYSMDEAW